MTKNVVEVGQRPLDELRRGGGIKGDAGLATAVPDHLQGSVQLRDGLLMGDHAIDPGRKEGGDEAVGIAHHEVDVDRQVRRPH